MANNPLLFNAAVAGACGGAHSSRWITDDRAADYLGDRNAAVAFATVVDLAIPTDATVGESDADLMCQICNAVLQNKSLTESSNNIGIALAVAALWNELRTGLVPVPGGGSDAPLVLTLFVDPDTEVDVPAQNGCILTPFATLQQAHDALPEDGGTIIVCDSEDGAGDLEATKSLDIYGFTTPDGGAQIGNISIDASSLNLQNIAVNAVAVVRVGINFSAVQCSLNTIDTGDDGNCTLTNCTMSGGANCGSFSADKLTATGISRIVAVESIVVTDSTIFAASDDPEFVALSIQFTDCEIGGAILANNVTGTNTIFHNADENEVISASATVTLQGCTVDSIGIVAENVILRNTSMAGQDITANGAALFDGCTISGVVTAPTINGSASNFNQVIADGISISKFVGCVLVLALVTNGRFEGGQILEAGENADPSTNIFVGVTIPEGGAGISGSINAFIGCAIGNTTGGEILQTYVGCHWISGTHELVCDSAGTIRVQSSYVPDDMIFSGDASIGVLQTDSASYGRMLQTGGLPTTTVLTLIDTTPNGFIRQLSTTAGDFPVGTTNWTTEADVPAFRIARIVCIPSGSSGASGGVAPLLTARIGSSGAGGSARGERWVSRKEVIDALPIAIVVPGPVAGPVGVSSTVSVTGTNGNPGAVCSFGSLLSAYPGAGGVNSGSGAGGGGLMSAGSLSNGGRPTSSTGSGQPASGGGGANGAISGGLPAEDGGASASVGSSTGTPNSSGNSLNGGGAGGAGGGHSLAGLGLDGGFGGSSGYRTDGSLAGNGATPGTGGNGADGSDGANATEIGRVGAGGGGGSGNGTIGPGNGGKGGNGGIPGGAGAGGGTAETDGVTPQTGGTAGDGARGEAVFEYYA